MHARKHNICVLNNVLYELLEFIGCVVHVYVYYFIWDLRRHTPHIPIWTLNIYIYTYTFFWLNVWITFLCPPLILRNQFFVSSLFFFSIVRHIRRIWICHISSYLFSYLVSRSYTFITIELCVSFGWSVRFPHYFDYDSFIFIFHTFESHIVKKKSSPLVGLPPEKQLVG